MVKREVAPALLELGQEQTRPGRQSPLNMVDMLRRSNTLEAPPSCNGVVKCVLIRPQALHEL